jgi:DNA-binding GntR family transcriptional regulator
LLAEDHIQTQELWQPILERLSRDIVAGKIAPGTRLIELELAARFGVSRGPVREALRELERQGVVTSVPRRGSVVCSLTVRDAEEIYAVREALELLALREASRTASDETLGAIRGVLERLNQSLQANDDWPEAIQLDIEFHRALVRAAGNSRLLAAWEQLASQLAMLIGVGMTVDPHLIKGASGHHERVLDALIERDPYRAGTILSANYVDSFNQLRACLHRS